MLLQKWFHTNAMYEESSPQLCGISTVCGCPKVYLILLNAFMYIFAFKHCWDMMLKTVKYNLKKFKTKQKQIQIVSNNHYKVENNGKVSVASYLLWENYAR